MVGLDRLESVAGETADCFIGRAGPREREHRSVLQRQVAGMLKEGAVREIESVEELAAAFRVDDLGQPCRCGARGRVAHCETHSMSGARIGPAYVR